MSEIKYDKYGRMKFHPDYHERHGKGYTTKELSYICKHYYRGNVKTLAAAMERTETSMRQLVCDLRAAGKFEHYKTMGAV
jgi:hypothetical protein